MSKKGKLVIISGFSGVGKGTVIKKLIDENEEFAFSVSGTTRYKREGEEHGVHYFFVSREEFEEGIRQGRFLEYAQYNGNYYGTPADYVNQKLEEGINIILDIEVQGAMQVYKARPEALMIFLIPPSAEHLVKRLSGRGTETHEQIKNRLINSLREAEVAPKYKYIVVNDKLEDTVNTLLDIVKKPEEMLGSYDLNVSKLAEIKEDLTEILKTF